MIRHWMIFGIGWFGIGWFGIGWFGIRWFGIGWYSALDDSALDDIRHWMIRHWMIRHWMIRHSLIRHSLIRHSLTVSFYLSVFRGFSFSLISFQLKKTFAHFRAITQLWEIWKSWDMHDTSMQRWVIVSSAKRCRCFILGLMCSASLKLL